jgi:uncharacterized protein YjiS (DUF1127 family)
MSHQFIDASVDGRVTSSAPPRTIRHEGFVATWIHAIQFMIQRQRQRKALGELAAMNSYLLRDIGMSQEVALREAVKPFWRQ